MRDPTLTEEWVQRAGSAQAGVCSFDGRPAKIAVATRTYPTAPDDVWDALTDPARIPRWVAPVTGDLRPGGRFQVGGNAAGEVLACDAPRRLALTWEYGDASWVEVLLEGSDESTP